MKRNYDIIGVYLRSVRAHKRYSEQERSGLIDAFVAEPSIENRNKLAQDYYWKSTQIAAYYARRYGLELLDLVQQGNLGILEALDKYDPEKGRTPMGLIEQKIRGRILDYVEHEVKTKGKKDKYQSLVLEDLIVHPSKSESEYAPLYQAIEQLKPDEQTAIKLYYGLEEKEHTCKEVGIVLGCTESWAAQLIRRVHQKLYKKLRE